MRGFVDDIEQRTIRNADYRRVLYTGHNVQLVLMSLAAGEEIGEEVHKTHDQFFRVEQGTGEFWIDGRVETIRADYAMVVPAGSRHNVKNTGAEALKLYTIYAPPEHEDGTVHATRKEALASHEHFTGVVTEEQ